MRTHFLDRDRRSRGFDFADAKSIHVNSKLEYKQVPPDSTGEAKLYRVTALKSDASESTDLTVSAGATLRLRGRKLTFDIADENQGVFMENESGVTRVQSYNRRGTNIVELPLPQGLSAGSYSISVVTKPGTSYFTANIDSLVTVSE